MFSNNIFELFYVILTCFSIIILKSDYINLSFQINFYYIKYHKTIFKLFMITVFKNCYQTGLN